MGELVWILTSVYEHGKDEVVKMIEAVLLTGHFELEGKPLIESALEDYRRSKADFADCLVGRRNRALGCEATSSFDWRLRSIDTFEVV